MYFWEKDFLSGRFAVRAFLHIHIVEGFTIWAFDSGHFIEMFVYYVHPLFLQFFLAPQFRGLKHEK